MAKFRDKTKPRGQMALEGMELIETQPKPQPPEVGDAFAAFWNAYPRKVDKYGAKQVWAKLMREKPPVDPGEILRGLRNQLPYFAGRGPFVPHPVTWLRHRRWLDVIQDVSPHDASEGEKLLRKMLDRFLTEGKL